MAENADRHMRAVRYEPEELVQRMVGNVVVQLELPSSWSKIHDVFHVSLLVQWLEGEPIYTVDRLDHRFVQRGRGRRIEYLVRWNDYGPENDTWEPRKKLLTCNAKIRA
eukprot:1147447-Pelagomonas_calceolata.AAC.12